MAPFLMRHPARKVSLPPSCEAGWANILSPALNDWPARNHRLRIFSQTCEPFDGQIPDSLLLLAAALRGDPSDLIPHDLTGALPYPLCEDWSPTLWSLVFSEEAFSLFGLDEHGQLVGIIPVSRKFSLSGDGPVGLLGEVSD